MKKVVINHWMNIIKKNKDFDDEKLAEIEYGLTGFYITISKAIVIFLISIFLGIFKEVFIFLLCFNCIRLFSFGIHAKKSWICWITSILIFIGLPLLMTKLEINAMIKIIIGIINCILIFIFSPADTKKRPIINKKRRLTYKLCSTFIAIAFTLLSIYLKNNFLSNSFMFALIVQNVLISPITYKIFNEPYNNYVEFLKHNPNFN